MNQLLNQQLMGHRAQLEDVVKDLHELTILIGHEELAKTVSELRNRLHEPFMFVIVGEVKAGKSSFINALLSSGEEIAKVAPQPMTDTIQQILYGPEKQEVIINPYLKKIIIPAPILEDIAIVDTPGTNTIVEHHQEITERFVPAADLIVFVFEAKNPYRQSAWAFFDFIHGDWRKKTIFVLQQKDLMPAEDLAVNFNGVKEQAIKKGLSEPLVFAVSAKQEQEGMLEESGFEPLRAYIKQHITGGKAPLLKLLNSAASAANIHERIAQGLILRRQQLEADQVFRDDIRKTLDDQQHKSNKQVDLMLENLLGAYDRITSQKQHELEDGLSLLGLVRRSVASLFTKKASAKEWLEQLSKDMGQELDTELKKRLDQNVADLADSIQQMAKIIDLKIRNSTTLLRNDHDIFSDIAERRENILRDLQEQFTAFINNAESFADANLFPDKRSLAPNLAAGSGIAAIGVIIMTVTNLGVVDITGGVLTAIGLLFAGFTTSSKRRKIIEGFRHEIENGRSKLITELDDRLKTYIAQLKKRIDNNFRRFDDMLAQEAVTLENLAQQHEQVSSRIAEVTHNLEQLAV